MPGQPEAAQTRQRLALDLAERLWLASKLKVLSPRRTFSMNDAVDVALFLTDRLFKGAGVRVRPEPDPGIPDVDADMGQVEQALVNVLVNACEATASGGTVTVATRYVPSDETVEVVIEDTGEGIPEEALERVFEPFYSTRGHIGVGLTTARELMSRFAGQVRLESAVGSGTKAFLRLPAARASEGGSEHGETKS